MDKNVVFRVFILFIFSVIILTGCSGNPDNPSNKTFNALSEPYVSTFDEEKAETGEGFEIDFSNKNNGYIAIKSHEKLKFKTVKDADEYVYDIFPESLQIIPLQCGSGKYKVVMLKNITQNKYSEIYHKEISVSFDNEFKPFLVPTQFTNFTKESACVNKAAELAEKANSEEDFIKSVYKYICKNVTYDEEKARTVKSGYIPVPDEILKTKKGICFDYASLGASMLRSQGIPTKIIFGYVSPGELYHAWNMFYTEETGWTKVEFKVNENDWSRIDLTFSASNASDDFEYTDVYTY